MREKTPNCKYTVQRAKVSVSLAIRKVKGIPKLREETLLMNSWVQR